MKREEIIRKNGITVDGGIIFQVREGYKKIREEVIKIENNFERKVVLLDDIPLVELSGIKSPMSSSIIKTLGGRSEANLSIQEKLNIDGEIHSLEDGFEKIESILSLLEDGEYELKEVEMIPTDGEDNDFWNSSMTGHYYSASADLYYRGSYIKGVPSFLVPSERVSCIDLDRVEYYREKIRNGEEIFGVALELRGFMALLLDGHHKAAAAYLEGKKLKCLLIKSYEKSLKVSKKEYKQYDFSEKEYSKVEFAKPKEVFPDFRAIAAVRKPIDISDRKIDNIFKFNSKEPIEEIKEIFYYMSIYDKEKAKKLCLDILRKSDFQAIWGICLDYLSKYDNEEINESIREIFSDIEFKHSRDFINSIGDNNRYFNEIIN